VSRPCQLARSGRRALGGGGSAPLLGGGVGDGEQRAAGAGEDAAGFLGGDDAEVGDLGLPAGGVAGEEDVLRLDVAVNHAAGVRGGKTGGDLAGEVQRQRHIEGLRRIAEEGAEVGAVYELHGEEETAVFGGFEVAAVHNIRMANLAEGADFAQEAGGKGSILAQLGGEKFQGAGLVHEGVLGEIDGAHSALAELAHDAVAVVDDHTWLEVADFVEGQAVGGTGGERVGITCRALRAVFHERPLAGRILSRLTTLYYHAAGGPGPGALSRPRWGCPGPSPLGTGEEPVRRFTPSQVLWVQLQAFRQSGHTSQSR